VDGWIMSEIRVATGTARLGKAKTMQGGRVGMNTKAVRRRSGNPALDFHHGMFFVPEKESGALFR
jgi:hypothetical protein